MFSLLQEPLVLIGINLLLAGLIRVLHPNIFSAILLAASVVASAVYLGSQYGPDVALNAFRIRDKVLTVTGDVPSWPPERLRSFPDLTLYDQDGELTRLSDFRGKVILLEPVGVLSRSSVAFAGGHEKGPFEGISAQENLERIDVYAEKFAGIKLDHPRLVRIQLILFDNQMQAPTPALVRRWAQHFDLKRDANQIVLAGTPALANPASHELVPGFQLIDKKFTLRANATGAEPDDSLYADLLPMIRKLLAE